MALFGKFFAKESCAVCGAEVGALKKRKLADGVMCKDCVARLSPWFEERRESTVAQIKEQLAMREENRRQLERFDITSELAGTGAVFVDEGHRWLCALPDASTGGLLSSERVHDRAGLIEANADIVTFDQVRSATCDITETRGELRQTVDGEQRSYSPRRWRYGESFYLLVEVDHPYIERMRVPLGSLTIETESERQRSSSGAKALGWLLDDPDMDVRNRAATYDDNGVLRALTRGDWEMPDYAYGFRCSARNWEAIQGYGRLLAQVEGLCQMIAG